MLVTALGVSLFDPTSKTFTAGPSDLIGAGPIAGSLLPSGDAFFAGGQASGAPTVHTEVYQAATTPGARLPS